MSLNLKNEEIAMLRGEMEMLMRERQALLRIAGSAAVFIAELDPEVLPEETYEAAEMLAECLNGASEETINDALNVIKAAITTDMPAK